MTTATHELTPTTIAIRMTYGDLDDGTVGRVHHVPAPTAIPIIFIFVSATLGLSLSFLIFLVPRLVMVEDPDQIARARADSAARVTGPRSSQLTWLARAEIEQHRSLIRSNGSQHEICRAEADQQICRAEADQQRSHGVWLDNAVLPVAER